MSRRKPEKAPRPDLPVSHVRVLPPGVPPTAEQEQSWLEGIRPANERFPHESRGGEG